MMSAMMVILLKSRMMPRTSQNRMALMSESYIIPPETAVVDTRRASVEEDEDAINC